jgi:hypothetical protein
VALFRLVASGAAPQRRSAALAALLSLAYTTAPWEEDADSLLRALDFVRADSALSELGEKIRAVLDHNTRLLAEEGPDWRGWRGHEPLLSDVLRDALRDGAWASAPKTPRARAEAVAEEAEDTGPSAPEDAVATLPEPLAVKVQERCLNLGERWVDLRFKKVTEQEIRVDNLLERRHATFGYRDFPAGAKGDRPSNGWQILLLLIEGKGRIFWHEKSGSLLNSDPDNDPGRRTATGALEFSQGKKPRNAANTALSALRTSLRRHFGIGGDPIERAGRGFWKAAFKTAD